MAQHSNSKATPAAILDKTSVADGGPAALFQPFQWLGLSEQHGPYDLLSDVRDLAAGVTVALQMIERSHILADGGAAPLLDQASECRLQRMSIAAMRGIEERIDAHFDTLGAQGEKA